MEIKILHLYPDLLNLYGDRGNLACLEKRLLWRGISAETQVCTQKNPCLDFADFDILFVGGGSDKEQALVCELLSEKKEQLLSYVEADGVLLAVCGGYPMLGKTFPSGEETCEGLGVLDITTEPSPSRLIGNVVLESTLFKEPIVGFENHSGKTNIGGHIPLGRVLCGHGNDGESGAEGVLYKNVFATYLHGPLLPKNPMLCDEILSRALRRKYPDFAGLSPLDDALEKQANAAIVEKCK